MFTLTARKREPKHADLIRQAGQIPAVVYGSEMEPQALTLEKTAFEKLYASAGESSLVDLTVEGEKEATKVLIQEVQWDPVKDVVSHVDLRQIRMGVEMNATIELSFVGESMAVKQGGTLIKGVSSVNVKCLPKDLVGSIEVDLGSLAEFDQAIKITDIQVPAGITITDNEETVVATVKAPLTEEQLAAMEETSGPASVEEIGDAEEKGKAEEAEGGDAPAGEKAEEKKDA